MKLRPGVVPQWPEQARLDVVARRAAGAAAGCRAGRSARPRGSWRRATRRPAGRASPRSVLRCWMQWSSRSSCSLRSPLAARGRVRVRGGLSRNPTSRSAPNNRRGDDDGRDGCRAGGRAANARVNPALAACSGDHPAARSGRVVDDLGPADRGGGGGTRRTGRRPGDARPARAGATPPPTSRLLDARSRSPDAVATVARALGYRRWRLVGHSLGGFVALELAARSRRRPSRSLWSRRRRSAPGRPARTAPAVRGTTRP